MNNLPEDLIELIYSYVQNPSQFKFINKYFCGIFNIHNTMYRFRYALKNYTWYNENLYKLINLTELNCSFNYLTTLPECLGNLKKLNCADNITRMFKKFERTFLS